MPQHKPHDGIIVALLGATALAVGSIGPWKTALGLGVAGTAGDGVITLVCAVVIALSLLLRRWGLLAGVAGILALVTGIVDWQQVHSQVAGTDGLAQVGWGLYVVIIGAALALGGILAARRELGRGIDMRLADAIKPRDEPPASAGPFQ